MLQPLKFSYKYLTTNEEETQKYFKHLTILHICSSHTVKTVLRKADKVKINHEQKDLAGCLISRLIYSDSLKMADDYFRMVVCVFGLPYRLPMFDKYFVEVQRLEKNNGDENNKNAYKDDGLSNDDEGDVKPDDEINRLELESHAHIGKNSPFYRRFYKIWEEIVNLAK